jgi:hypothetical protein
MTIRLGRTSDFPAYAEVRSDFDSFSLDGPSEDNILGKNIFWPTDWTAATINFAIVEKLIELGEEAFKKCFLNDSGSPMEYFYSHSTTFKEKMAEYIQVVTDGAMEIDSDSQHSARPASRLFYYFCSQSIKGQLCVPILTTSFINAAISMVRSAQPALVEVSTNIQAIYRCSN